MFTSKQTSTTRTDKTAFPPTTLMQMYCNYFTRKIKHVVDSFTSLLNCIQLLVIILFQKIQIF